MTEYILEADKAIFLFFNGIHSDFWDNVLFMFSGKFVWVPMYAIILFAFFRAFNWRIAIVWVLCLTLAIVFSDQICATFIRPYFERLRPSHPETEFSSFVHIVNEYRGGRYGFPSCHAANSFALAMMLALVWKGVRLRWFIFIWAFLNSYSRLYLGVHYPGDLLVGAIIGMATAWCAYATGRLAVARITRSGKYATSPKRIDFTIKGFHFTATAADLAMVIGIVTTLEILLIATD